MKPVFSGFCNFGHFWSRHPRRESGILFSRICKMQKIVRSQRQSANGFFPFLAFLTKPVKNRYFTVSSFMFSGKLTFWTLKSRFLDPLRKTATRGILDVFGQKGVKMTTFWPFWRHFTRGFFDVFVKNRFFYLFLVFFRKTRFLTVFEVLFGLIMCI